MKKWEKVTHFKWTITLLSIGLGIILTDYIVFHEFRAVLVLLLLVVLPVKPFSVELRHYDFHKAMEYRGADWRKVK